VGIASRRNLGWAVWMDALSDLKAKIEALPTASALTPRSGVVDWIRRDAVLAIFVAPA
jgi:hypothetical protein